MKEQPKTLVFYLGILLFAAGLLLVFLFPEASGAMRSLPFVLTGFGSGIISVGVVAILRQKSLKSNPEKAKAYAIAEKDERNIRLREKAGYAVWYVTLVALAVLSAAFVVLDNYAAGFLTLGVLFVHAGGLFVFIHAFGKRI